jgi:FtsP/CotA-like multicopper oxidase with cupredoxin domain
MERGSRTRTEALTRRILLKTAATAAVGAAVNTLTPARGWAAPRTGAAEPAGASGRVVDLTIRRQVISIAGREATAMVINAALPGPCCASGRARP